MSHRFEPFVVSDGHGPTVVLVHGGWTDHSTWDLMVPHLTDSYRVVRYDRRGHSRSRWDEPVPRRQDEDDLAQLIEHVGAPVHVVGNSYGASIALGLTGRRPELVTSLAVHEPPLLDLDGAGTRLGVQRQMILDVLDEVAAEIRRGRPEAGARRFVEEVALGPGAWDLLPPDSKATMVSNAHTLVGTLKDPRWGTLAASPPSYVPLLLSDGADSPAWLRTIADDLATAVVPNAHRLTLVTGGHVPHLTNPAEYAIAVRNLMSSTTRSTTMEVPS